MSIVMEVTTGLASIPEKLFYCMLKGPKHLLFICKRCNLDTLASPEVTERHPEIDGIYGDSRSDSKSSLAQKGGNF